METGQKGIDLTEKEIREAEKALELEDLKETAQDMYENMMESLDSVIGGEDDRQTEVD